jgi:hypothetical protein
MGGGGVCVRRVLCCGVRVTYQLQAIRRLPLSCLEPRHHFILQVWKFLTDIRLAANAERGRTLKNQQHLQYLEGRLHGVIFGFADLAIYGGWYALYEEVGGSAMNEAGFLCDAAQYQKGAA